ncbi:extracellular solute-binding protein [Propioniciclava soli]|uniref:Extracellular solute-binding protein n=1 Tax=Propioniciclava soli TaxID=2775081 RepID=A0ABZ3CBR1_9ACTN
MTRRRTLAPVLAAAVSGLVLLSACGAGEPATTTAGGDAPLTLRFTWWGNDNRLQTTSRVIEAFEAEHPNIRIQPEPGDWSGYWDRLATQSAANDTPDVIQMDEKYIVEYGSRGLLLDLADVDTGDFAPGTVELGEVDGTLVGINAGINAPSMAANPTLFEQAGVELPDDTTWTWDDFQRIAQEISAAGGGESWGAMNMMSTDAVLKAWLRQHGKEQWTADGIAYEASDVADYWSYFLTLQEDGSIPPASVTGEDEGQPIDQSLLGTNRVALGSLWSNQYPALDRATGESLLPLRLPRAEGTGRDAELWYKASMYWSASARSAHPEEAKIFIDYLANNVEAGTLLGTDRGVPANLTVREAIAGDLGESDRKVVEYLDSINDELGAPSLVPPMGGGQSPSIQLRYAQAVMFGTQAPEPAAEGFVTEVRGALG